MNYETVRGYNFLKDPVPELNEAFLKLPGPEARDGGGVRGQAKSTIVR